MTDSQPMLDDHIFHINMIMRDIDKSIFTFVDFIHLFIITRLKSFSVIESNLHINFLHHFFPRICLNKFMKLENTFMDVYL